PLACLFRSCCYVSLPLRYLHSFPTRRSSDLASKFDCEVCALKMRCCPKGPAREVPRDVHEYERDVARRLMRTKAYLKSRDQPTGDRKSTRLNSSHVSISYAVFCLKKKKKTNP